MPSSQRRPKTSGRIQSTTVQAPLAPVASPPPTRAVVLSPNPVRMSAPPGVKLPPAAERFEDMGLSTWMLKDIRALGFTAPTPIQSFAIPVAQQGFDLIGAAQTGTGKTAAFLIPIIEAIKFSPPKRVKQDREPAMPRALVLAPTRELAQQIEDQAKKLTASRPMSCAVLVGGGRMLEQSRALSRGVTLVIATPGRLLDHLQSRRVTLDYLEFVVLDEADRMFDMGFEPQIRRLLDAAPKPGHRQTMMFSATMPRELTRLADAQLIDPVRVEVAPPNRTASGVKHDVKVMLSGHKLDILEDLLFKHLRRGGGRVLVFVRQKVRADQVADHLRRHHIPCARMHADRSQEERERALQQFRDGRVKVLVATDLASRGLDVIDIERVINFDFPQTVDDYIHRVGRTARAGKTGWATSFVEPADLPLMLQVEQQLGRKLERFGE